MIADQVASAIVGAILILIALILIAIIYVALNYIITLILKHSELLADFTEFLVKKYSKSNPPKRGDF